MATIVEFEQLEVWKMARKLNIELRGVCKKLAEIKEYPLQNQLKASAGSVMDNIAEGFERGGNKEPIQFLSIAKGSAGEVRSQLWRAYDISIIDATELENLKTLSREVSAKLARFIQYLRKSETKGIKYKLP